jgi:FMN phosphatase YigB (HAD superfamily)
MTYNKIVVFDLDETLGYFVQLGILIDVIEEIFNIDMEQNLFNEILDLYPEFLRPNIIKILKYLKQRNQINNKNNRHT